MAQSRILAVEHLEGRIVLSATLSLNGIQQIVGGENINVSDEPRGAWTPQNSPTTSSLNDIHFASVTDGVAVGQGGAIARTFDGGRFWGSTPLVTEDLSGVHFDNGRQLGFAVGDVGRILRGTDMDKWSIIASPTRTDLNSVFVVSASRAWIVGDEGEILYTNDGGTSWVRQTLNVNWNPGVGRDFEDLHDVYFIDSQVGWAVGEKGAILKTVNQGARWDEIGRSDVLKALFSVQFRTPDLGWAVGDGIILRTQDGGSTWSRTDSIASLNGVYFTSDTKGWAAGESIAGGIIFSTVDGGSTWSLEASQGLPALNDLEFVDATNGWTVGEGGGILVTTMRDQREMMVAVNPTDPLNVVAFSKSNIVTGSVDQLEINLYHSHDGGRTWNVNKIEGRDEHVIGGLTLEVNDPQTGMPWPGIDFARHYLGRDDPALAFDAEGRLYVSYMFTPRGYENILPTKLIVARSDDGGGTFHAFADVLGPDQRASVDKPILATGPAGPGSATQALYATYVIHNDVYVTGSRDAGLTWEPQSSVNSTGISVFSHVAVGPNGELYVTWNEIDSRRIRFRSDIDGLWDTTQSFGTATTVDVGPAANPGRLETGLFKSTVDAQPRRGIFNGPVLDVDARTGKLYIAYVDTNNAGGTTPGSDDTNIFLAVGEPQPDGSVTWTGRIPVESSSATNFLPWVDVDSTTGSVNIVYYTTESSPSADEVNVRVASTTNPLSPSPTFAYADLNTQPSNAGANGDAHDFLEYIGIAAHDGTIHTIWSDNRPDSNGLQDDLEIYTASASFESDTDSNVLTLRGDDGGVPHDDTFLVRRSPLNSDYLEVLQNDELVFAGLFATVDRIDVYGEAGVDDFALDDAYGSPIPPAGFVLGSVNASISGAVSRIVAEQDTHLDLIGSEVEFLSTHDESNVSISDSRIADLQAFQQSTVDVATSEIWAYSSASDNSSVTISGDQVFRQLASGTSTVNVEGGFINTLEAMGNSNVNIVAGFVSSFEASGSSAVEVAADEAGWRVVGDLEAKDAAAVNIRQGRIDKVEATLGAPQVNVFDGLIPRLTATDQSQVNVYGGSIPVALVASGVSVVNISGGQNGGLSALADSTVNIYGTSFDPSFGPVSDLSGTLRGTFLDGTAVDRYFEREEDATINLLRSGDFNGDGEVDRVDRMLWFDRSLVRFGARVGESGYNFAFDFDGDGIISSRDYYAWLRGARS